MCFVQVVLLYEKNVMITNNGVDSKNFDIFIVIILLSDNALFSLDFLDTEIVFIVVSSNFIDDNILP